MQTKAASEFTTLDCGTNGVNIGNLTRKCNTQLFCLQVSSQAHCRILGSSLTDDSAVGGNDANQTIERNWRASQRSKLSG